MPCPHKSKALKVLTGELAAGPSTRMLEHFRVCGECRAAFDFAASALGRASPPEGAPAAPAVAAEEDADPFRTPDLGARRAPDASRRNRRIIAVVAIAMFAFAVAGLGGGASRGGGGEAAAEAVWGRLLREGTPVVQSPCGALDSAPRVITALLPPGAAAVAIAIVDQDGRTVYRSEEKPGERGCFVEEGEIDAPGGAFRAGRLLVPFPGEDAAPLAPGVPYGVVVSVGGAHASASSVFQLARTGPLHPAPRETR